MCTGNAIRSETFFYLARDFDTPHGSISALTEGYNIRIRARFVAMENLCIFIHGELDPEDQLG